MSDDRHDDPGNESNESDEQFDRWLQASVRDYNRPRAEALPHQGLLALPPEMSQQAAATPTPQE